jgi:hypothetical protein
MLKNSIILGIEGVVIFVVGERFKLFIRVEGFGFVSTAASICLVGFVTYFKCDGMLVANKFLFNFFVLDAGLALSF